MIEAKDTVMSGADTNKLIHPNWYRKGIKECKPSEDKLKLAQAKISFKAGVRHGIRMYAWWQDGVQFVGTTGRKLKDALLEYED